MLQDILYLEVSKTVFKVGGFFTVFMKIRNQETRKSKMENRDSCFLTQATETWWLPAKAGAEVEMPVFLHFSCFWGLEPTTSCSTAPLGPMSQAVSLGGDLSLLLQHREQIHSVVKRPSRRDRALVW